MLRITTVMMIMVIIIMKMADVMKRRVNTPQTGVSLLMFVT